jgi:hypothetical protein
MSKIEDTEEEILAVSIHLMDGSTLELELAVGSDIKSLKVKISEVHGDSPATQQLYTMSDGIVLDDTTVVAKDSVQDGLCLVIDGGDQAVLMCLYEKTDGENWKKNENWGTDAPLSTWYGVTTDEDGSVIRLELSRNNMIGELPGVMGQIMMLRRLDLSTNKLTGAMPDFSSCRFLEYLYLQKNLLRGEAPDCFELLSRLQVMDFGNNLLMVDRKGAKARISAQLSNCHVIAWSRVEGYLPVTEKTAATSVAKEEVKEEMEEPRSFCEKETEANKETEEKEEEEKEEKEGEEEKEEEEGEEGEGGGESRRGWMARR